MNTLHTDFLEFISELTNNKVKYVIIGGLALAYYGHPRYTGDLDIWIYPEEKNTQKTFKSIEIFFETSISVLPKDFIKEHNMITLGEEPVQIQMHIRLDGVTTQEIWGNRVKGKFGKFNVYYIGKDTFIKNKTAVGRMQDLADIEKIK